MHTHKRWRPLTRRAMAALTRRATAALILTAGGAAATLAAQPVPAAGAGYDLVIDDKVGPAQ